MFERGGRIKKLLLILRLISSADHRPMGLKIRETQPSLLTSFMGSLAQVELTGGLISLGRRPSLLKMFCFD